MNCIYVLIGFAGGVALGHIAIYLIIKRWM